MHLSAILVTGDRLLSLNDKGVADPSRATPAPSFACAEIFGQSVLERTVVHLRKSGVRTISVITGPGHLGSWHPRDVKVTVAEKINSRWSAAERTFRKHAQHRIDAVLIAELGAYVELDPMAALRFHKEQKQSVTPVHDQAGSLGYWLVDSTQARVANSFHTIATCAAQDPVVPYKVDGYVNRLAHARDFRRLAIDSFMGRCSIRPRGQEIKPGVWADEGTKLHKMARLVAPAYLGCGTQVRTSAIVTRFSHLERNCMVGEGSLVANASILPHTVIGAGLDISAALVDGGAVFDLRRNVLLSIRDRNLISGCIPVAAPRPRKTAELEPPSQLDPVYAQYLSRAAGRLLEVFKGEV